MATNRACILYVEVNSRFMCSIPRRRTTRWRRHSPWDCTSPIHEIIGDIHQRTNVQHAFLSAKFCLWNVTPKLFREEMFWDEIETV